jgi:hypothetical protein
VPYIKQEQRAELDEAIDNLSDVLDGTDPGEINYVVTKLLLGTIDFRGDERNIHYAHINMMVGALECIKLELYRRMAVPYEDKKIEENGDVY